MAHMVANLAHFQLKLIFDSENTALKIKRLVLFIPTTLNFSLILL
jgi:hypothetical protein